MIDVKTPKDIMAYEERVIGPLTLKQLICFILVVVVDLFLHGVIIKPLNLSFESMLYIFPFVDIPILAFGYIKPMGLHLDRFLKMVYRTKILAPAKRKNKCIIVRRNNERTKKYKKSKTHIAYL